MRQRYTIYEFSLCLYYKRKFINQNSRNTQKNHTTCATMIAAALHGLCENRVRFQRRVAANTNTIAAAPLGTINIGTCGNKFNSYFRLSLSPVLRIVADKDRNEHRATWKRGNKSQSLFCRL